METFGFSVVEVKLIAVGVVRRRVISTHTSNERRVAAFAASDDAVSRNWSDSVRYEVTNIIRSK